MTTIPVFKEGAEGGSGFPVGGRPLEWRAVEEAAAFEKWFDQPSSSPETQQPRVPAGSSADADGTPAPSTRRVAQDATEGCIAHERTPNGATQATTPNSDAICLARQTGGQGPVAAAGQVTWIKAGGGPEVARPNTGTPGAPPPGAALHQWSKTALTAVVDDQKVRLWVRDYHLTSGELKLLQQGLLDELRRLGYRLAQLVVNGETHYAQDKETDHGN